MALPAGYNPYNRPKPQTYGTQPPYMTGYPTKVYQTSPTQTYQSQGGSFGGGLSQLSPPRRTSIYDSAKKFQNSGLIPKFNPLQVFGEDYFQNIENQATKRLREQYFDNDNSVLAQRENSIKKRGLFGSGIGEGAVSDVYKSFGDELGNVQSDIARQRAENQLDLGKFNAQMQNDLASMLLSAAGDESRSATDFDTKIFGSLADIRKGEQDSLAQILESLAGTLGTETIDTDTRDFFESLYGSRVGDILGRNYQGRR